MTGRVGLLIVCVMMCLWVSVSVSVRNALLPPLRFPSFIPGTLDPGSDI